LIHRAGKGIGATRYLVIWNALRAIRDERILRHGSTIRGLRYVAPIEAGEIGENGRMSTPDPTLITFLYVADLQASHEFYSTALGLELSVDQGDCRIYRVNAGAFLGVCERPDQLNVGGMIVTIVTDDVEATHSRLVAAGATVDTPPEHSAHYRITHAFYRDPDGHVVEIQRFDDPKWAG